MLYFISHDSSSSVTTSIAAACFSVCFLVSSNSKKSQNFQTMFATCEGSEKLLGATMRNAGEETEPSGL